MPVSPPKWGVGPPTPEGGDRRAIRANAEAVLSFLNGEPGAELDVPTLGSALLAAELMKAIRGDHSSADDPLDDPLTESVRFGWAMGWLEPRIPHFKTGSSIRETCSGKPVSLERPYDLGASGIEVRNRMLLRLRVRLLDSQARRGLTLHDQRGPRAFRSPARNLLSFPLRTPTNNRLQVVRLGPALLAASLLLGITSCASQDTRDQIALPTTTVAAGPVMASEGDRHFREGIVRELNLEVERVMSGIASEAPSPEQIQESLASVARVDELAASLPDPASRQGAQAGIQEYAQDASELRLLDESPEGGGLPFLSEMADLNTACRQLGFDVIGTTPSTEDASAG